jgi:MFS family permease
LGAVAAGPVGGLAIEAVGRKGAMLLLALPFFLGWLLIHFATTVTTILIGRFITGNFIQLPFIFLNYFFHFYIGFFAGTFAVAAPIFTAEVTDVGIRGAVGSTFDMMISLGILFM